MGNVSTKNIIIISMGILLFIVLIIVGIYISFFATPATFREDVNVLGTMDLQIYLSDAIVLATIDGKNDTKIIDYKMQTENGEKTYKKSVTDTPIKIKDIYLGNLNIGDKVICRNEYS